MSQSRKSISKQALAWTAVFALVLSVLPYTVADQNSDEYFESWSYELSDTDGDDQYDTILFTFDPNTNVSDYVDVEVNMNVRDSDGNYVDGDNEDYEIYWTEEDSFEMEWFVDDCDDWDGDCEGPFNFEFSLYENINGYTYFEDNFTESNISLYETTLVPEGIIQVDHGVIPDDLDGTNNDIAFFAHMKDYEVENVTIELERKVGVQWVDVGDQETDGDGNAIFKNMTNGEYRWSSTYDGESIDALSYTFVFAGPNSDDDIGHVGGVADGDEDGDYDDFGFYRIFGNGSGGDWYPNDGVYVELFHAGNNTLYEEDGGDGNDEVVAFHDVPEGNYTFNMYNESSDGDLLQSGWMHSYGSLNTNYGEYFESWSNHTTDTNGDGVANNIFVEYNPDTECNCTVDIMVSYNIYDADTGMFMDYESEDHEINGTEVDEFETDVFYAPRDSNYTFEFYLYDTSGENWNYEDNFSFTVYLECDSSNVTCDSDEYFESWSYHTNDTNGDGIANNLYVEYNPDTDCNCSVDIQVSFYAISENGDYQYGDYYDHNITGTEVDNFTIDRFYPSEDANYTFYFTLYDNNWNFEDEFNFTVYLECDTEDESSSCDYDEWFESSDHETEDDDGDNLEDTINIFFDPNTECTCQLDVNIEFTVYVNSSGSMVDYGSENFVINHTEIDNFEISWTSTNSSSYDFQVRLYDNNWNYEDGFWIRDVYLYQASGAGGPGDDNEFFDWIYQYIFDGDNDGNNDTVEFNYDPDTTCNCYLNVTTSFDFYDNQTGDLVDSFEVDDRIYNEDDDNFHDDWSPLYNGTFDIMVELYDEDGNLEDWERYNDIQLNIRTEHNESGDSEEYFSHWEYNVEGSDTISIGYDPDTTCDCEVFITVIYYVYDNNTGEYLGNDETNHYIESTNYDWFEQEWSASYNSSYDFYVYLYNEGEYLQDSFEIFDVYLSISDNGDDSLENGIAHLAYIIPLGEDEYVNDFIGIVSSDNEVFFEVLYDGDIIESGYSEGGMWIVDNLQEGWYDFYITDDNDEDHMMHFQSGSFYSFGNNSHNSSDIVNVGIAVGVDEDFEGDLDLECDAGPCDDVGIIAYIGDPDDGGVVDINFDIFQWNSEEEEWEFYVTLATNESGMDMHHDTPCGEYMWMAELNGNEANGRFDVHANCESNEYAWFVDLVYDIEDTDGNDYEDTIMVTYSLATSDCGDCEMDLLLILDIFDENDNLIDTLEQYFRLPSNEYMDISFVWTNHYGEGNYIFQSMLEYLVDGDTDGEIRAEDGDYVEFYLDMFVSESGISIEDVTGRDMVFEGQNIEYEVVIQGPDGMKVNWSMGDGTTYQDTRKVFHTYQDSGNYEIVIHAHDGSSFVEAYFQINVRNMNPTIVNIMMDETVNEGDDVSFNVQYQDAPMDMNDISVRWIFPDGILEGNFVQYTFEDDGEFLISVEVKDDDGGSTMEQRMVTVQNVAPVFTEFALPSQGEQGVAMDFRVSATDPGDDTITYTFDFGDGTALLITQNGNASHKFASGDTFEIVICAIDEDGGETCRTEVIPVALLEEIEESGLPGFGFLGVISALGAITLLRRRTH